MCDSTGRRRPQRPGADRRTDLDVADDLASLLEAAHIQPPYVLVGHSVGGDQAWLYADRHPEGVAGFMMMNAGFFDARLGRAARASGPRLRSTRSEPRRDRPGRGKAGRYPSRRRALRGDDVDKRTVRHTTDDLRPHLPVLRSLGARACRSHRQRTLRPGRGRPRDLLSSDAKVVVDEIRKLISKTD